MMAWSILFSVSRPLRLLRKTVVAVVALFATLAVVTEIGVWRIDEAYPPQGRFVDIAGGRLHVVELGKPDAPPVVLLHGASDHLADMRLALGDRLAQRYRVILVDRPGHGWSDRPDGEADSSPSRQAALIHQAVVALGVKSPIVVGHSWSGALAAAYALAYPTDVRGVVLLAPATHPFSGGVGWFNEVAAVPVVGWLIAHTVVLPAGYFLLGPGVDFVFSPQKPPADYVARTGVPMLLRPSEYIANAEDLIHLNANLRVQSPRYGEIAAPVAIVAGDADPIVDPDIHARAMAKQLPHATLTILPGVGHMVHYAAPDRVVAAIDKVAAAAQAPQKSPLNNYCCE